MDTTPGARLGWSGLVRGFCANWSFMGVRMKPLYIYDTTRRDFFNPESSAAVYTVVWFALSRGAANISTMSLPSETLPKARPELGQVANYWDDDDYLPHGLDCITHVSCVKRYVIRLYEKIKELFLSIARR